MCLRANLDQIKRFGENASSPNYFNQSRQIWQLWKNAAVLQQKSWGRVKVAGRATRCLAVVTNQLISQSDQAELKNPDADTPTLLHTPALVDKVPDLVWNALQNL